MVFEIFKMADGGEECGDKHCSFRGSEYGIHPPVLFDPEKRVAKTLQVCHMTKYPICGEFWSASQSFAAVRLFEYRKDSWDEVEIPQTSWEKEVK